MVLAVVRQITAKMDVAKGIVTANIDLKEVVWRGAVRPIKDFRHLMCDVLEAVRSSASVKVFFPELFLKW